MLDHLVILYQPQKEMLRKINREHYIEHMDEFRAVYGELLLSMTAACEQAEDSAAAADEIGKTLLSEIGETYFRKGKIKYNDRVNVTMFTVYYVFPAILMTGSPCASTLCDGIKNHWTDLFDRGIDYTTFEDLRDSFRETILGFPFSGNKNR